MEILLIPGVRKASFRSDRSMGLGVVRMHERQACDIPLLRCPGSKVWPAASGMRAMPARVDALESRYDGQFNVVFDAIRGLMRPPESAGPASCEARW